MLFNFIYIVCIAYATIYGAAILLFFSKVSYIYITKYIMFRRYKYMSPHQLRNINYGHLSKAINNRIQAMRNYVYIRDTWPYIQKTIYGYPEDNKTFEQWVNWVHENYYEDNLSIIQCLEDIIEGKTNKELIDKTDICIRRINYLVSQTRLRNLKNQSK